MHLERSFPVWLSRDEVVDLLCRDETLLGLFPGGDTEIVERSGDTCTTRTRYNALGREGVATFHFTFLLDGDVRFEKVCDGVVWRELVGQVHIEERSSGTRLRIEMKGRTKPLVPEFSIKGQMEKQLEQMEASLRARLEGR